MSGTAHLVCSWPRLDILIELGPPPTLLSNGKDLPGCSLGGRAHCFSGDWSIRQSCFAAQSVPEYRSTQLSRTGRNFVDVVYCYAFASFLLVHLAANRGHIREYQCERLSQADLDPILERGSLFSSKRLGQPLTCFRHDESE